MNPNSNSPKEDTSFLRSTESLSKQPSALYSAAEKLKIVANNNDKSAQQIWDLQRKMAKTSRMVEALDERIDTLEAHLFGRHDGKLLSGLVGAIIGTKRGGHDDEE